MTTYFVVVRANKGNLLGLSVGNENLGRLHQNDRKVWKMSRTNPTDGELWKKALRKLSTVQPPGRGTEAL